LPLPWEITQGLETSKIGKKVYYFDSIDSTQNQALKLASDAKNDGAVIIAQRQTGGKGRDGRRWISPKGGIWLSVILHPDFDISVATLFPLASSLALSNAIEKIFKIKSELKWPNDVNIKGKKIAGILVDASLESNKIENIVLGVGINFDVNPKEIERNLKNTPNFYGVSSLSKFKKNTTAVEFIQVFLVELEKVLDALNTTAVEFIQVFLVELEKVLDALNSGQVKKIVKDWTKKSSTIGNKVQLNSKEGKISGNAIKIDDDGALVIAGKKNTRVLAGDIIHLTK
jgi:BirA family biotin operon repressor/biotin-[acetyl-CoA-carboxylase] ligase